MDREAVIQLIKDYLSIEVREVESMTWTASTRIDKFIDLKFDGEVISSTQIE